MLQHSPLCIKWNAHTDRTSNIKMKTLLGEFQFRLIVHCAWITSKEFSIFRSTNYLYYYINDHQHSMLCKPLWCTLPILDSTFYMFSLLWCYVFERRIASPSRRNEKLVESKLREPTICTNRSVTPIFSCSLFLCSAFCSSEFYIWCNKMTF